MNRALPPIANRSTSCRLEVQRTDVADPLHDGSFEWLRSADRSLINGDRSLINGGWRRQRDEEDGAP
ncbi:hypothetical protein ACLOJK_005292 [Asimina triloba]